MAAGIEHVQPEEGLQQLTSLGAVLSGQGSSRPGAGAGGLDAGTAVGPVAEDDSSGGQSGGSVEGVPRAAETPGRPAAHTLGTPLATPGLQAADTPAGRPSAHTSHPSGPAARVADSDGSAAGSDSSARAPLGSVGGAPAVASPFSPLRFRAHTGGAAAASAAPRSHSVLGGGRFSATDPRTRAQGAAPFFGSEAAASDARIELFPSSSESSSSRSQVPGGVVSVVAAVTEPLRAGLAAWPRDFTTGLAGYRPKRSTKPYRLMIVELLKYVACMQSSEAERLQLRAAAGATLISMKKSEGEGRAFEIIGSMHPDRYSATHARTFADSRHSTPKGLRSICLRLIDQPMRSVDARTKESLLAAKTMLEMLPSSWDDSMSTLRLYEIIGAALPGVLHSLIDMVCSDTQPVISALEAAEGSPLLEQEQSLIDARRAVLASVGSSQFPLSDVFDREGSALSCVLRFHAVLAEDDSSASPYKVTARAVSRLSTATVDVARAVDGYVDMTRKLSNHHLETVLLSLRETKTSDGIRELERGGLASEHLIDQLLRSAAQWTRPSTLFPNGTSGDGPYKVNTEAVLADTGGLSDLRSLAVALHTKGDFLRKCCRPIRAKVLDVLSALEPGKFQVAAPAAAAATAGVDVLRLNADQYPVAARPLVACVKRLLEDRTMFPRGVEGGRYPVAVASRVDLASFPELRPRRRDTAPTLTLGEALDSALGQLRLLQMNRPESAAASAESTQGQVRPAPAAAAVAPEPELAPAEPVALDPNCITWAELESILDNGTVSRGSDGQHAALRAFIDKMRDLKSDAVGIDRAELAYFLACEKTSYTRYWGKDTVKKRLLSIAAKRGWVDAGEQTMCAAKKLFWQGMMGEPLTNRLFVRASRGTAGAGEHERHCVRVVNKLFEEMVRVAKNHSWFFGKTRDSAKAKALCVAVAAGRFTIPDTDMMGVPIHRKPNSIGDLGGVLTTLRHDLSCAVDTESPEAEVGVLRGAYAADDTRTTLGGALMMVRHGSVAGEGRHVFQPGFHAKSAKNVAAVMGGRGADNFAPAEAHIAE